jgi:hypothetical protein
LKSASLILESTQYRRFFVASARCTGPKAHAGTNTTTLVTIIPNFGGKLSAQCYGADNARCTARDIVPEQTRIVMDAWTALIGDRV